MYFTIKAKNNIPEMLSLPRFNSYQNSSISIEGALKLYQWNIELSSAYLVPLHFYEVILRNCVSNAIEASYTHSWHNDQSFINSLNIRNKESINKAISKAKQNRRVNNPSIGAVIAEMYFIFWERMFTNRYDNAIWGVHLNTVLPNSPSILHFSRKRTTIFDSTNKIRKLRNRIAHHEPIFNSNRFNHIEIVADIEKIISWRCIETKKWLNQRNKVLTILSKKPRDI